MSQRDGSDPGTVSDEGDSREPYEAPRFEWQELFEVLALACGKQQPITKDCQRVNRVS